MYLVNYLYINIANFISMYYFQTWLIGREGLEAFILPDKIKLLFIYLFKT